MGCHCLHGSKNDLKTKSENIDELPYSYSKGEKLEVWRCPILSSPVNFRGLSWLLSWYRIHLQCSRPRFDSWVGKFPWRRNRLPTPVFLGFPGGSYGKESACNVGDLGLIPGLGRSPEEGMATETRLPILPKDVLIHMSSFKQISIMIYGYMALFRNHSMIRGMCVLIRI